MIALRRLDGARYAGREYAAEIVSGACLEIAPPPEGFSLRWVPAEVRRTRRDTMLADWLDGPVGYGAFVIIGFDRFAYASDGPETGNMRVEMGKKLCCNSGETVV